MIRSCGCTGKMHELGCAERSTVHCKECGQAGHTARLCGVEQAMIHVRLPKAMLADIDKVAATLERGDRKGAVTRLLIEALCARGV